VTLQDIPYADDGLKRVDILGIVLSKSRTREGIRTSSGQRDDSREEASRVRTLLSAMISTVRDPHLSVVLDELDKTVTWRRCGV